MENRNKNKQQKIVIALLAAAVVLSISFGVWAAGSAGTEPVELITKDYIDNYLMNYINNADKANADKIEERDTRIKELEERLESNETDSMALESGIGELEKMIEQLQGSSGGNNAQIAYETVHLTEGQKLMAAGEVTESCEVVVRSGRAEAVSSFKEMGISDISTGQDLLDGDLIGLNHSLIIPRGSDGRGVKCVSAEVWLLVRGKYTIV